MSWRLEEIERLLATIREIWQARRKVYGSPRITVALRSEGRRCGKNLVARLMEGERDFFPGEVGV